MSYRASIGTAQAGDIILLSRPVYTTDLTPVVPLGAVATVSILDNLGNLVTSAPAIVTQVTSLNLPTWQGFAGYTIDYSITLPDTLVGTATGLAYTALLQFSITTLTSPLVLPDVQEGFLLVTATDLQLGPQPLVLIPPYAAVLTYNAAYTLPEQEIDLVLYFGNMPIGAWSNIWSTGTWNGGKFTFPLDTSQLRPRLMPYAALWTIEGNQEVAPVFVINPSISLAMRELNDFINKNSSEWNPDLVFTPEQLIAGLYNGACLFNAEHMVTDFDMTNAMGTIRSFWVQYSAVWVLQSQVLNGIQTDFQFTNSSVTLDVDRASKYQQFADGLENQLRDRVRGLKAVMAKRGNISGDGSANPLVLRPGAIAALGLSLSPVSKIGSLVNPLSWRSAMINPGLGIGDLTGI